MKQNLSNNVLASDALKFLGPLTVLLGRGDAIYRHYMANGKTFLYAKILKDNNARIRELIIEKAYLLPIVVQPQAIELLVHIDVWYARWEALEASKVHGLNDEFVFANEINFPQSSVNELKTLYLQLKDVAYSSK